FQKDDVLLKEDVDIKQFIGKHAKAPGIEKDIIILPATFVDEHVGTGIVTSVPSDAPYDYVSLRTLQQNEPLCKGYGLNYNQVRNIQLIPIIKTKGFNDFPGKEIVEKMGIRSLDDPKLEEATKEVYKAGFHGGVMRETCGKYSGLKVEEAKERIKTELLENGKADLFHDLSEEVVCRCGNKVVIKRIDDQWFIKYSDAELTAISKEYVPELKIYPKEYKENLPSILDWFGDRACTRLGNWLGSKFPFDEEWTVEPISDSTLYPAYYIVSKFVNNDTISIHDLNEDFFDYVFLGKGTGKKKWKEIKEEFDYFYPLDLNLGGKEHQTVHFPVFIMNHLAILPKEKWPKGIFVNWWVTGKGGKISKSKGGAEPIPQAIEKYGVDAMRLYYAHIGLPHVDVIWTEETVLNYKNALERIYALTEELRRLDGKKKSIDNWLVSKIHEHIRQCNTAMENYNLRELASIVYYTIYEDLKWYLRRGGENKKVISEAIDLWIRLMNPITPHISEELNDSDKLVSASSWPEAEQEKISKKAEAGEELVKNTMEGMRNVLSLAKISQPRSFTLFIAESWKYELVNIIAKEIKVTRNAGEIMKRVLSEEKMKMKGKEISSIVLNLVKDTSKIPVMVTSQNDELSALLESKKFLEKEYGCDIKIIIAEDSQHQKARSAMPGKPGILAE
ncbi:MAG: class I tRNA ligase family protein, partial [Nanoarchaeota archaeon]